MKIMKPSVLLVGLCLTILISISHSQDAATIIPATESYISFHWKGALTSHSIILKVFPHADALTTAGYTAYLALYTKTDDDANPISNVQVQALTFVGDTYPVATVQITGLSAQTDYDYTFVVSASEVTVDTFTASYPTGDFTEYEFKTLGIALTPYNFTFGASCCAQTGSSNVVFDYLRQEDMDFFIHTGDLHSEAIATDDVSKFYKAYYSVLNSSVQKKFFQEHSVFYIWDDLDFGAHNSNGTSASRPAVTEAYTNFVPADTPKNKVPTDDVDAFPDTAPVAVNPESQYQGGEPTDDGYGIYRSFIVGRTMFIIMDLKSYKDIATDDILGSDQRNWLQNQFIFAKANTNIVQIFLISSIPWIHTTNTSDWGPYAASTQEYIETWANNFKADGRKVMVIAGDAHMVAFDDGTNNNYGSFPVVQAGALDQSPTCKGGPYSHGLYAGRERYALFEVIELANGTLCVKVHLETPNEELIFYDTCHPKKSTTTAASCDPVVADTTSGGTSGWLIALIGLALLGIVGYIGWSCYKNSQEAPEQKPEEKEGTYMELSETRKKRENDQL